MINEKRICSSYILCVIEDDRERANEEYKKYFEMYPPQGYFTHMLTMEDIGEKRRFTVERRASCD